MHGTLPNDFAAAHEGDIASYLLVEKTALCKADAALIFGNRDVVGLSAFSANRLYQDGLVDKIIVSGGKPTDRYDTEAEALKYKLLSFGIPQDRILMETRSTNTQQNIQMSKHAVEQAGWSIESLIGIGHIKAGRRFLMTLKKNWPEVFAMASNVNPYGVKTPDWQTHPGFYKDACAEMAKIRPYINAGFIAEIDLHAINANVQQRRALQQGGLHYDKT